MKKNEEKKLWELTLARYQRLHDLMGFVYDGLHSDGNSELEIPSCSFCDKFCPAGSNHSCFGCPVMKLWGKCGEAGSQWHILKQKTEELMLDLNRKVNNIEDKISGFKVKK